MYYRFGYTSKAKIIKVSKFFTNMRNFENIYNFSKIYSNSKKASLDDNNNNITKSENLKNLTTSIEKYLNINKTILQIIKSD